MNQSRSSSNSSRKRTAATTPQPVAPPRRVVRRLATSPLSSRSWSADAVVEPSATKATTHCPTTEDDEYEDQVSPFLAQPYITTRPRHYHKHNTRLRRVVQRVSRQAALTTKQVVWDSNDASIDAALQAVDQWEGAYNALRGLLVATGQSCRTCYDAAKIKAAQLEHGLLIPVRDWILLPAFGGVERVAMETVRFLHSDQAQTVAQDVLATVQQVPWVGANVLAPTLCFSVGLVQRSWEIAQYPIPSKHQVRNSVDFALNGTKWALSTAFREVYLYIKRADANITRTLSHTQWKVLGSGPYATLDKLSKQDVIDHLCERYNRLQHPFARYELAAHVRALNRPLYNDLVSTGVWKERGGELTEDDEWLLPCPVYRALETPFLLEDEHHHAHSPDHTFLFSSPSPRAEISALWFRLPNVNGKRPGNDAPWVFFREKEQRDLEQRYRDILTQHQQQQQQQHMGEVMDPVSPQNHPENAAAASGTTEPGKRGKNNNKPYPTIAKWYTPTPGDVLVDQNRHVVSFLLSCASCRRQLPAPSPPLAPHKLGDICEDCRNSGKQQQQPVENSTSFGLAPLSVIMRPVFWRFYGPGDQVRRAAWFLDTPRNGLQPFDEEAQTILEDAYLFLNWMSVRQVFDENTDINDALLTVEVAAPDKSTILVQFGSLTHATAIQKGIGAAIAIFKRRVYRGAWLKNAAANEKQKVQTLVTVEESILQAVEESGALGETLVPDVSLRSVLTPPRIEMETSLVLYHGPDEIASSLAVPPARLYEEDMARFFANHEEKEIDHLVLIVHGIGEMMRSIDMFGLSVPNLASIVDCCGYLRKNHVEVLNSQLGGSFSSVREGRVEYLPVEWHEAFSILSQRRSMSDGAEDGLTKHPHVMLSDISLRTIPQMRDFANDTLMDVLYFMSPEHHDVIVDVVASEMNAVVQKFRAISDFDGRVSVIGHSLGSIISWDILGSQKQPTAMDPASSSSDELSGSKLGSSESLESLSGYGSPMSQISETSDLSSIEPVEPPMSPKFPYAQLDFSVENLFLLGSPVAVFLMIRNQRAPLSHDFYLSGCRRVFNIFHPYDPVAYRIEPCIDPRNSDFEPVIIQHWNGGLRVKYQTKRLWRLLMETTWQKQQDVVEALEAGMAGIGLIDSSGLNPFGEDDGSSEFSSEDHGTRQVKTGSLNRGRRIDYLLQEKEIESANEYVAALAAHSSYWIEKDFILFVARQIARSTIEREAAEGWESIE